MLLLQNVATKIVKIVYNIGSLIINTHQQWL